MTKLFYLVLCHVCYTHGWTHTNKTSVMVPKSSETAYTFSFNIKKINPSLFIHIPKTGGTSIEFISKENGIHTGIFASYTPTSPYERMNIKSCTNWHIPPKSFVRGSWCIIRDHSSRLISEYLYQRQYKLYQGKKINGDIRSCENLYTWVKMVKSDISSVCNNMHTCNVADCHFIPQITYAKMCDVHVPFEEIEGVMKVLYNYTIHQMKSPKNINKVLLRTCNVSELVMSMYA